MRFAGDQHQLELDPNDPQVRALARAIAEETWRKMRRYIAKQNRELHDLMDEEE